MVLRDGKVIARQAGAMPLPALRDWVRAQPPDQLG
jgi:transposase